MTHKVWTSAASANHLKLGSHRISRPESKEIRKKRVCSWIFRTKKPSAAWGIPNYAKIMASSNFTKL